jgi:hypothetical protein
VVEHETPPWTDTWVLAQADRYLDDASFRRTTLERSLTNHENLYSRARLSAYALEDGSGWDALPVWVPHTAPATAATTKRYLTGQSASIETEPIWDGVRPQSMAAWVALGRRVFFEYPLRPEIFAEHALAHPDVARDAGLTPAADGSWPGLVVFADIDRQLRVGITCALCHTAIEDGKVVAGRARREFDYGTLRLAYHRDTGAPLPAELAQRMATWGPGRADITEDDDQDPVAIPDLWGIREQSALTAAGTIRHLHPAALAIRQETQILHANRERTRPPRELAWALAMYVYALSPPERRVEADTELTARGETLFAKHCRRCHGNSALGGDPIRAELVGTDPALASSTARGTGAYRPAPLVRVADAAPYLHHGVVPTLDDLLSPDRLAEDYDRGTRGPGPIHGHTFGTTLAADDRAALIAWLRTR